MMEKSIVRHKPPRCGLNGSNIHWIHAIEGSLLPLPSTYLDVRASLLAEETPKPSPKLPAKAFLVQPLFVFAEEGSVYYGRHCVERNIADRSSGRG
jgi:hypothetical protein